MRIALVGTRGVPARYGGFETRKEEVGKRARRRVTKRRAVGRPSGRRSGTELTAAAPAEASSAAGPDATTGRGSTPLAPSLDMREHPHAARGLDVLVAHPSTELYGSDRQLLASLGALTAAGANVTVALPGDGPLPRRVRAEYGLPVVSPRFAVLRKSELRPVRLLLLLLRTPGVILNLTRTIAAMNPDVVYVNTVTLPHWVIATRLARRRVVVHVHEAEELSSSAIRKVLYAPLLAANRVVANSETTRRVVTKAWRRLRARTHVVPNGLPDPGIVSAPTSAGPTEPRRLVVVSRLSPRKGIDVALEALAELRTSGHDVHLTVCGSTFTGYEWFEEQLRSRAARPDLAGAVTFAGFVDPAADALAAAEIVLVPSLGESFGNAAVEGMLARRPVVASDVQGLAEIFTDGRTGLLVPPGDATAIAHAVARLLADAELSERIADAARREAVEHYSINGYRDAVNDAVVDTAAAKSSHAAAVIAACALAAITLAGCTSATSSSTTRSDATRGSGTSASSANSTAARTPTTSEAEGTGTGSTAPDALESTVASRTITTRAPVALSSQAAFGDGIRVEVTAHDVVQGKARGPGEVAGPALRLGLRLENDMSSPVDLSNATISVTDARDASLSRLTTGERPFVGTVAPGKAVTARYQFSLAGGRHNPYTVNVSYSGRSAVVQFAGDAA